MVKYYLYIKSLGIVNDYYIAVGITYTGQYEFPLKKFYWALSSDYKFSEMPDLNDQHVDFVDNCSALFEGNPFKKVVTFNKEEGEGITYIIIYLICIGEEEGGQNDGGENGEGNEEGSKVQENLSDLSEEEEIKVPPKDLRGKELQWKLILN